MSGGEKHQPLGASDPEHGNSRKMTHHRPPLKQILAESHSAPNARARLGILDERNPREQEVFWLAEKPELTEGELHRDFCVPERSKSIPRKGGRSYRSVLLSQRLPPEVSPIGERCSSCKVSFGWLKTRKRHCSICGWAFCSACSSEKVDHNDVLLGKHMCESCSTAVECYGVHKHLGKELKSANLSLNELYKLATLSDIWRLCTAVYLREMRYLQGCPLDFLISNTETEFLTQNRSFLVSHYPWCLQITRLPALTPKVKHEDGGEGGEKDGEEEHFQRYEELLVPPDCISVLCIGCGPTGDGSRPEKKIDCLFPILTAPTDVVWKMQALSSLIEDPGSCVLYLPLLVGLFEGWMLDSLVKICRDARCETLLVGLVLDWEDTEEGDFSILRRHVLTDRAESMSKIALPTKSGVWEEFYSPFHGKKVHIESIVEVGRGREKRTVLYLAPGTLLADNPGIDMLIYIHEVAPPELATLSVIEILHRVLFPSAPLSQFLCKRAAPMMFGGLVGMNRSWKRVEYLTHPDIRRCIDRGEESTDQSLAFWLLITHLLCLDSRRLSTMMISSDGIFLREDSVFFLPDGPVSSYTTTVTHPKWFGKLIDPKRRETISSFCRRAFLYLRTTPVLVNALLKAAILASGRKADFSEGHLHMYVSSTLLLIRDSTDAGDSILTILGLTGR